MSAGSLIRATPPSRRMSAGTRSSAMTETAPASSAILACSAVTTSMITPPRSMSARPRFTANVPVLALSGRSVMAQCYRGPRCLEVGARPPPPLTGYEASLRSLEIASEQT